MSRVDRDNMEDTDIDSSEHDMLTLYVRNVSMSLVLINQASGIANLDQKLQCHGYVFRSGFDGKKYGACPACQRVFMVLMMKAARSAPGPRLQFLVATVPPGRAPVEFKRPGLRHLPAIIFR